jgi:hypothetical protein
MNVKTSFYPIDTEEGAALLSQNSQFQWFSQPTYFYPMALCLFSSLGEVGDFQLIPFVCLGIILTHLCYGVSSVSDLAR